MQLNQYTKALGDETRLRILMLLIRHEELCVCQFTESLQLSQPKVSRHLAILRDAGLLQDRKSGQWVYYHFHKNLPEWVLSNLNTLYLGAKIQAPYTQDKVSVDCDDF